MAKVKSIKLGNKIKGKPRYAFFVEAKRPKRKSIYQREDDYVKLMKEMKEGINRQIDLGIQGHASFGLFVEGRSY
ncbi:hypothetical protein BDB01DRAFT_721838 [Pilobolus umbonatus]|nr:hypothetical protein BDB01DRAFT_721838 [Pilobolus umbonatus]